LRGERDDGGAAALVVGDLQALGGEDLVELAEGFLVGGLVVRVLAPVG